MAEWKWSNSSLEVGLIYFHSKQFYINVNILETVIAFLVIISNIVFTNLTYQCCNVFHEQNKFYAYNHCISNLSSAVLIITTSLLQNKVPWISPMAIVESNFAYFVIYNFFLHLPFTCCAIMAVDIAYYCHHAIEYNERVTNKRLFASIFLCWALTLAVVCICYNPGEMQRSILPVLPFALLLVPESIVLFSFIYVMKAYFNRSRKINCSSANNSSLHAEMNRIAKARKLVKRFFLFVAMFLALGAIYFVLYVINALQSSSVGTIGMHLLYLTPRMTVLLNSLFTPWAFCPSGKYAKYIRRVKRWQIIQTIHRYISQHRTKTKTTISAIFYENSVHNIGVVCVAEAWTVHAKNQEKYNFDKTQCVKKQKSDTTNTQLPLPNYIYNENDQNQEMILEGSYINVVRTGLSQLSNSYTCFVPHNNIRQNVLKVAPAITIQDLA